LCCLGIEAAEVNEFSITSSDLLTNEETAH
jgi:hypothetical protein